MLTDTFQSVELASKEGKTFLRRMMREDDWTMRASASTDWRATFYRTIKGKAGAPDVSIEVRSDCKIGRTGKTGMVQSFGDSRPVQVVEPRGAYLSSCYVAMLAKLLLDGARLTIHCSSGSTNSSYEGLSFYTLGVSIPGCGYGDVEIGGHTIAKEGQTLTCGAVDIR